MPPDTTDILQAEKDYLKSSRAALAVMRDKTGALEVHSADRVNQEYLQAAIWRRMKELEDDPDVPLFFGRLDYLEPTDETFHIGRRHVNDDQGEPLVVDWRARHLRAVLPGQPDRADGRGGTPPVRLHAWRDDRLRGRGPRPRARRPTNTATSSTRRSSDRVSGPMRDIVATIQPEQDVIVRAGVDDTICVQGAPGTGKTAVGLHRAAYLLYAYRDQLSRAGVLVVGPNASFLRYIGDVLPALGEIEAKQTTVEELVARVRVAGPGPAAVDVLKGDARMAGVLHRAVWSQVRMPTEALVVPRGSHRWRVAGVPGRGAGRRAARRVESGTAPAGRCCRSDWRTPSCCGWRRPVTHRTTGCRTRWPGAARSSSTPKHSGPLWTRRSCCSASSPTRSCWPSTPTGSSPLKSRRC